MAYYRCGGGGLPAGLQSGMDSVFNKKFGTATSYAPGTWPDTVNLMGPLPEKTIVSSPIADFNDGADQVPTKNVVVNLPATLSGVSTITETQTGRNILDFTVRSQYGITTTKGADGGAIISGTASGGDVFVIDFVAMDLEAGKYNILVSGMAIGMSASWTKNGAYGGALNEGSNVITLSAKTTIGGYVRVTNGSSYPDPVTVYVQLTIGQDSEPFEKYAQSSYSANLGRTIYGGTADLVTGEGVDSYKKITLDGSLNWAEQSAGNIDARYYIGGITTDAVNLDTSGVSNMGVLVTSFAADGITVQSNGRVSLCGALHSQYASVEDLKTALNLNPLVVVYKLATPTDFTFTGQEIPTMLGYNAFWSDQGDTEVTYRADINLALGGQ